MGHIVDQQSLLLWAREDFLAHDRDVISHIPGRLHRGEVVGGAWSQQYEESMFNASL